jgi:hypothetical protein
LNSAESAAIAPEVALETLKQAKGFTLYEGWKPFCMACPTFDRMSQQPYGFQCSSCQNMIGWDLCRLDDSPLNHLTFRGEPRQQQPIIWLGDPGPELVDIDYAPVELRVCKVIDELSPMLGGDYACSLLLRAAEQLVKVASVLTHKPTHDPYSPRPGSKGKRRKGHRFS